MVGQILCEELAGVLFLLGVIRSAGDSWAPEMICRPLIESKNGRKGQKLKVLLLLGCISCLVSQIHICLSLSSG